MIDPPAPVYITLDDNTTGTRQRYTYIRIVRSGDHRIRVRIDRDTYRAQSSATAEVLSEHLTGTHLVSEDPSTWHDQTTPPGHWSVNCSHELADLAERLLIRATTVLNG
ncbi:hypothetical protein FB384_005164 [Prauserella sediminis]|uniref:Uncharacterized protein n=1 Tax=Prauserella sediminis TaxID=577680 RepID=A0A839Y0K9_9PSEU|nr:hypothetical protein [Prauserella sediminis]MBB3666203.1 hypothetical protein [Prauserella sediminis]